MSLLAIAWTIVAFLVGALVVVLCVVMANLFRVLTSTKDLIDGVTSQTVPLLGEVNTTVTLVNQELIRVDGILATAEGCGTVEALGAALKCGTNCGSCVPELKALIATTRAEAA